MAETNCDPDWEAEFDPEQDVGQRFAVHMHGDPLISTSRFERAAPTPRPANFSSIKRCIFEYESLVQSAFAGNAG